MKNHFLYVALWLIGTCIQARQSDVCIPVDLTCEYLVNPIGLDVSNPRLAWKLQDFRSGALQTACRIWVDTDSLNVVKERATVWIREKENRIEFCGLMQVQHFNRLRNIIGKFLFGIKMVKVRRLLYKVLKLE